MSRFRTESKTLIYVDDEIAWRIKEIVDIRSALRLGRGGTLHQDTLIRAGVVLLYAHWEGFIKKSAEALVGYVAEQRLPHEDLSDCYWLIGVRSHLLRMASTPELKANLDALKAILSSGKRVSRFSSKGVIDTQSNLSSVVLERIVTALGLSFRSYELKRNLIDKSLVDRRNHIAHGQVVSLTSGGFLELSDEIIALMRAFKDDVQNQIVAKGYLKTMASGHTA